ncbi:probable ubiquitin carboxyl-terminal hydrolase MINDY-4 isoform X2 [Dreissena polymorpha]|uniref:probable ubiquitin carboxyl-terminal hydrolase MINDY-4 isoform X2 n=1 Tax=Dreissena polymorpha TaxID=45954 RepID=UPI002263C62F|nr:probable ubiquitin carboxyl-terminal hydrolase MINDY-4 isoform X2 [Dreissena polymorpha]
MTNEIAESITASLVREYLSRKGLKTTLQVLDEELPRDADSISNRQQLVKELHIEKIMKKNKEQSQPLKAMLEVITQHLLMSRPSSSMKNGDLGQVVTKQGPSVTMETNYPRSGLKSAYSSKSQYPTVEDTDSRFDGFPMVQQTDEDDLLKPDPNFSYPSQRLKPKPAAPSFAKKPENKGNNDLVIEDSVEGETILGDGKAGVMSLEEEEDQLPTRSLQSRPRSSNKPRSVGLGMSGPIINTEDTGRRKFNKPRPMSASKNQRLNIFENDAPKLNLDSINPISAKSASTPTVIHSKPLPTTESATKAAKNFNFRSLSSESDSTVKEIETLISGERKKSIQDVLEIEKETRPHTATRRQSSIEKETQHYSVDKSSIAAKGRKPGLGSQTSSSNSLKVGDLEMGDVDNLDDDLAKLDLAPRVTSAKVNKNQYNSKPIDVKTAVALKQLVFGNPMASFNDEWKFQSFSFCDMPKLKYGIVQKKGGPCGVLASVQACVLQELLFGEKKIPPQRFNEPTYEERTEALSAALAKVFWRCGEKRKAVVCLPSSRPVIGSGGKFKADEFIETLSLYTFIDFEELSSFMKQVVSQFELDGQGGVMLSLYSAILSRKVEGVKDDMDVPTNALMGAHGYCTQEMVNLYLSGRAVSNVFNDVMELDSGDGNIMMLKGVVSRCDVGLLSLFEHYKSCQVGTYMKTPRYPIWVICSESHFSVLFCVRKELTSDWKAERRFDLYYFDGLARQQEEIRLTVDTNNRAFVPPSHEELVPPIDHCIRTKWEGAEVDWNGTEPLL